MKLDDAKKLKTLMARSAQLSVMARGANMLTVRKYIEEKDEVIHEILKILCTDAVSNLNG